MRILIRWFCLCMLILFFVFSMSGIDRPNQEDLRIENDQISHSDMDQNPEKEYSNAQLVTKRK